MFPLLGFAALILMRLNTIYTICASPMYLDWLQYLRFLYFRVGMSVVWRYFASQFWASGNAYIFFPVENCIVESPGFKPNFASKDPDLLGQYSSFTFQVLQLIFVLNIPLYVHTLTICSRTFNVIFGNVHTRIPQLIGLTD